MAHADAPPVIVDSSALADHLDIVQVAIRALQTSDPMIADALRGSAAQVRATTISEP